MKEETEEMTYEEFAQELARGEIRPAYCFAGEEIFLVEEGARKVIEAVLPGPERGFSLVELTAEAAPEEIRRALASPSFFGAKRVVRIRELERLNAEALESLAAGVRRLPPGTYLVALGRPDGRRSAGKEFLSAVALVECPLRKKGEAKARRTSSGPASAVSSTKEKPRSGPGSTASTTFRAPSSTKKASSPAKQ